MKYLAHKALILSMPIMLSGCTTTQLASEPMRALGTLVSYIPAVGETVQSVIGASADLVDASGAIVKAAGKIVTLGK